MQRQPLLIIINIVEGCRELVVAQGVAGQVFDDDLLQLAQLLVDLPVVLREGLDVVARGDTPRQQTLHIGEHGAFLVLHVLLYLTGILIVEFQDEGRQRGLSPRLHIEGIDEFAAYERQLEAEIIVVARPQILHQRVDGQSVGIVVVEIAVDGVVHHSEERVGVDAFVFAHFAHSFVAKAEVDAERPEALQDVIVVADDGDEFIVRLIHFLIFHIDKLTS